MPALVRWMLVFEQPVADELWLARALPRTWLAHGQCVRVTAAPTRWGPVGYAVRSLLDEHRVEASLTLPEATPVDTWLRLRLPLGHRIASAMQDGRPVQVDRAAEAVRVAGPAGAGATTEVVVVTEPDDGAGQT
ncbi:hypothetical protein GCM10009845_12770 [Pedococcus bigeumensis]